MKTASIILLISLFLFSCSKPTKEVLENPSPHEIALQEKIKKEREQSRIEQEKRNPPVGTVRIIEDELGCKWITLTVQGKAPYGDHSPAYSVDIEHHPKCENHNHGIKK